MIKKKPSTLKKRTTTMSFNVKKKAKGNKLGKKLETRQSKAVRG